MQRILCRWTIGITWLLTIFVASRTGVRAEDWPQFRFDAGRTAASPQVLAESLQLRWVRTLALPSPAFPNEVRLAYDASYEPVVLGKTMFVPSMVTDSLTALDTETGQQRWRYVTDGPVRFAPVAWNDRVFCVSDDGHLYCLSADSGALLWKFRGLPSNRRDRRVLGNGRLVSLWPARGGPVLADGVVYFAAGLWPTDGVYVHAVDAVTGKAVWTNNQCSQIPAANLDHGIGGMAGLTPQGYLAISGDRLIVPCGTQLPAFLSLQTGELQKYTMGWGGRLGLPKGCWFVSCVGKYLSHAGDLYDITRLNEERLADTKPGATDFKPLLYPGGFTRLIIEPANQRELDRFSQPIMTPEVMYESGDRIAARDLTNYSLEPRTADKIEPHRVKDEVPDSFGGVLKTLWEVPSTLTVFIKSGNCLYSGGPGIVEAFDVTGAEPKSVWRSEIEGTPTRMLAADDKLFVITADGAILAFAAGAQDGVTRHVDVAAPVPVEDEWTAQAKSILDTTHVRDGYALVWGIEQGRLVEELVRQSNLQVIALDEDAQVIDALRARLLQAGMYGTRVTALTGDPLTYPFPPYLANLIVSEAPDSLAKRDGQSVMAAAFRALRPYGGVACAWGVLADQDAVNSWLSQGNYPGAVVSRSGAFLLLTRSGALPGAADWSHLEADASSTGVSSDELRAPTSVLWFDAARRWHKYPGQVQVRVVGGRVIVYEKGLLQASDVFTGRVLWEAELSGDDASRRRTQYVRHREWGPSPALSADTELVAVDDAIYLSEGAVCNVFNPADGQRVNQFHLPADLATSWANVRISGNLLIASSGKYVLCLDRHSGQVLWRYEAARDSLYLAVGGEHVYCAELVSPQRGEDEARDGSLCALDLRTGRRVWTRPGGCRFRYSAPLDLVVTATALYRGKDGEPVSPAAGQPATRLVITGGGLPKTGLPGLIAGGNRLLTGGDDTLQMYQLPASTQIGEPLKWVRRGCTGTRASTNLLTTRLKGNAAWIDLESGEITPIFGIRPACAVNNNLYPANGVLNIPGLTAGCTCNYSPVSMACVPAQVVADPQPE